MSVKQDISRLQKNRFIHFQVGLILSICFVLFAFSWTTDHKVYDDIDYGDPPFTVVEQDIVRTAHKKPPPPKKEILNLREIEEVDELPAEEPVEIVKQEPAEVPIEAAVVFKKEPIIEKPAPPVPKIIEEPEEVIVEPEITYNFVDQMPMFPGCAEEDYQKRKKCAEKAMLSFIYSNIKYPAIARENGIEGQTVIRFIVDKDGSIIEATPLSKLGGGCTKEAMRVINKMPKWNPGLQKSNPVKVYFNLPIKFILEN